MPRWRRPWTVTVATGALLGTAAVLLLQAAACVYDLAKYPALVDRAGRATGATAADIGTEKSASNSGDAVTLVVLLVCVLVLLTSAAGLRRASNRARLVSLAASVALLMCCTGTVVANNLVASQNTALEREAVRLQDASYPAWFAAADAAALLIYPLLLVTFVLLLLPVSNRFFRAERLVYLVPVD
ncbi:hypothetical protein Raf01_14930 [Rugosimonospora africana]|uniref:Uncharacterized protein n=2 Tax=Rugosimonospora africana TaxID=556532 RepID=A0A8J3QMK2_9ACTN|nr:hypothetical protein Raf01_14930 [Rugosimonospora africana]